MIHIPSVQMYKFVSVSKISQNGQWNLVMHSKLSIPRLRGFQEFEGLDTHVSKIVIFYDYFREKEVMCANRRILPTS